MIIFLYGKSGTQLLKELNKIKRSSSTDERVSLSRTDVSASDLVEVTQTPGLFGQKILVTLDITEFSDDEILEFLQKVPDTSAKTDLVYVANKNFVKSSRVLKEVRKNKKIKVILVPEEKDNEIFSFMDAIFEKNRLHAYSRLKNLILRGEDEFKMHSMVLYHIRNLARIKYGATLGVAPFIKIKLQKQAKFFSKQDIKSLYEFLYNHDKNIKTGKTPPNLIITASIERILET